MFAPGAGRSLAVGLAAIALLGLLIGFAILPRTPAATSLVVVAVVLWGFFAIFFRDPERVVGEGVVSPADGTVRVVREEEGRLRIGVFMNVTDVHVNRFPLDGRVLKIEDAGAGFRPAFVESAEKNLQRRYTLETPLGVVDVIQMTGILARRLRSYVEIGEERPKGARLGMIYLGSRVDVVLPSDRFDCRVRVGDRVWAGASTIGVERV